MIFPCQSWDRQVHEGECADSISSGNRIQPSSFAAYARTGPTPFLNVIDLDLSSTLVTWTDLEAILPAFSELTKLSLASNSLGGITESPTWYQKLHIKSLYLSSNNITSLSDIRLLQLSDESRGLQFLSLRSNPLTTITTLTSNSPSSQLTLNSLHHLDLARTLLSSFTTLNPLPTIAPHLTSLITTNSPVTSLPDARLETIARIGSLKELNFSPVGEKDRMNAEIWYLNRIANSSDAVSRAKQSEEGFRRWIEEEHPRFWRLCEVYGEPEGLAAVRASKGNGNGGGMVVVGEGEGEKKMAGGMKKGTLGARLVTMTFFVSSDRSSGNPRTNPSGHPSADSVTENEQQPITLKLPPSISITALKALIIPSFFPPSSTSSSSKTWINPFRYRLIWETGEYDPPGHHASTMQDGGDWSDDDEDKDEDKDEDEDSENVDGVDEGSQRKEKEKKKRKEDWVQREVELSDGAKDVGYWIEAGGKARVRIERK